MARAIDTVTTIGTIKNKEDGLIELVTSVGGSNLMKTARAKSAFETGDEVVCKIRVKSTNSRSIISIKKIEPTDLFFVGIDKGRFGGGANFKQGEIELLGELVFGEQVTKEIFIDINDAIDNFDLPVPVRVDLDAKSALVIAQAANEKLIDDNSTDGDNLRNKNVRFGFFRHSDFPNVPSFAEEVETFEVGENWIGGHWLPSDAIRILKIAPAMLEGGDYINILATGPSGNGKTTMFAALAEKLGFEFKRVNCAIMSDAQEWFGYDEAVDGSTVFRPTHLTELIERGNCVIVWDELNRAEPWITNSLFSLLDDSREVEVHNRTIKAGPNIVFGMTVNEGFQYTGTHALDTALRNRVDVFIQHSTPTIDVEREILSRRFSLLDVSTIARLVKVLTEFRSIAKENLIDVDLSVRSSIKIARLVQNGLSLRDAFTMGIVNSIDIESSKPFIDTVNAELPIC